MRERNGSGTPVRHRSGHPSARLKSMRHRQSPTEDGMIPPVQDSSRPDTPSAQLKSVWSEPTLVWIGWSELAWIAHLILGFAPPSPHILVGACFSPPRALVLSLHNNLSGNDTFSSYTEESFLIDKHNCWERTEYQEQSKADILCWWHPNQLSINLYAQRNKSTNNQNSQPPWCMWCLYMSQFFFGLMGFRKRQQNKIQESNFSSSV